MIDPIDPQDPRNITYFLDFPQEIINMFRDVFEFFQEFLYFGIENMIKDRTKEY